MSLVHQLMDNTFYAGRFTGDYKETFNEMVTNLLSLQEEGASPSIESRKVIIEIMTDEYIKQTGQTPDGVQVQRLANWLLLEDLSNNHPDKVTREEYPFMTKRQLRTRYHRERADEHIPVTHTETKYLGGKKQPRYKVNYE